MKGGMTCSKGPPVGVEPGPTAQSLLFDPSTTPTCLLARIFGLSYYSAATAVARHTASSSSAAVELLLSPVCSIQTLKGDYGVCI